MAVADDPDAKYIDVVSVGVHIGVGIRMPRTPAVYERKRKWALDRQRDAEAWRLRLEAAPWRENYSSAKEEEEEVQRQLDEMVEARRLFVCLRTSSRGVGQMLPWSLWGL